MMLYDLAAWVVIILVAWAVGRGVLALLRVAWLRPGDQFVIATWIGIVALSAALLAVSILLPLRPLVVLITAVTLGALGITGGVTGTPLPAARLPFALPRRHAPIVAGSLGLAIGAAALTSDAVTLYDSLVYHIGIVRWLGEHGTVPGTALVHNRLGHVSAWFTLAAAFDHGFGANRSATVPLGIALVLVGIQTAIAAGRVAARRALVADWFILCIGCSLLWAVSVTGAATPSPDVATNVLVAIAAWSLFVVAPGYETRRDHAVPIGPYLIPLILALGATTMKLFAAPAAIVTAIYFIARTRRTREPLALLRPTAVAAALAAVVLGPFLAANVAASGCPVYPSPVGCLPVSWSVGPSQAADYAEYIRDVARWDRRGNFPPDASAAWIGPWITAHPVMTGLALASVLLTALVTRRLRIDASRHATFVAPSAAKAVLAIALSGVALAAWEAPAPRFFFAVVMLVPSLALSLSLSARARTPSDLETSVEVPPRFTAGFVAASFMIGLVYAVASQKLNVRSAVTRGAPLVHVSAVDLVLPAAPEPQTRLFRWRINDVDVLTPVPLPIADTLGYQSVIAHNAAFEKCSTAPLPCTPYLPPRDVRLRRPARGLAGGFRRAEPADLADGIATCVGELSAPLLAAPPPTLTAPRAADVSPCRGTDER